MCARLLACPLCSQPGFLTLDALRAGLISVATRPLTCPVCNEILLGIDKLTIHLFSHTVNLSNHNTAGSLKHTIITNTSNPSTINNLENTTSQDWNVSKIQITDSNKLSQNNLNSQNSLISSQSLQNTKNKTSVLTSEISIQDQNLLNHVSQVTFLQNRVCGNKEIHALHRSKDIELDKDSQQISQETIKLNYATEYFTNENVKHVNFVQNYPETEYENVQIFKNWMQDQHCEQQNENVTGSLAKGGQIELIFNENKYNCPTCGKKFKKEQHVMQHLKTHEAKQWECDVCSKMFTTKYFLKKHKRLHSGEMPYKCNICNKTFTFQQSYHKHRLYHKDDKPHTCTTCGRSFKELSTLHNHERIHTGEKPFACETCGKCFRQRVSYLVHRRIHTGVMPYKCTTCGKSFRYKVSQRTHKCPVQQIANIQQTNTTDQKSVNVLNIQSINNDMYKTQKNFLKENQSMLNIVNNEENKYVLIINTQGQHLLTKESNIEKTQTIINKKQKLEECTETNNENEETRNIWKSDIPNNPIYKKSSETCKTVYSKTEKPFQEDTNDFLSMVISPFESGLSSPTIEMEHLRVSSPTQKEDILKSYDTFKNTTHDIEMNMFNTDIEPSFGNADSNVNNLHTINEESLKQLLYSINEK